jgi:hypothetical protein
MLREHENEQRARRQRKVSVVHTVRHGESWVAHGDAMLPWRLFWCHSPVYFSPLASCTVFLNPCRGKASTRAQWASIIARVSERVDKWQVGTDVCCCFGDRPSIHIHTHATSCTLQLPVSARRAVRTIASAYDAQPTTREAAKMRAKLAAVCRAELFVVLLVNRPSPH